MTFNLRSLLEEMIQRDASDLHITAAERPKLRVDGDMSDMLDTRKVCATMLGGGPGK